MYSNQSYGNLSCREVRLNPSAVQVIAIPWLVWKFFSINLFKNSLKLAMGKTVFCPRLVIFSDGIFHFHITVYIITFVICSTCRVNTDEFMSTLAFSSLETLTVIIHRQIMSSSNPFLVMRKANVWNILNGHSVRFIWFQIFIAYLKNVTN